MHNLIKTWNESYFTDPANFLTIIITLIVCYSYRNSYQPLKLLPVYLISFIILCLTDYSINFMSPKLKNGFASNIFKFENFIVTLIEFATFSYYLYSVTRTKAFKKIIATVGVITFVMIIVLFSRGLTFDPLIIPRINLENIYILESSVLLVMCSFYFVELFTSPPVINLTRNPDFWISSGLLFYVIVTFPVTIITTYLIRTDYILAKNFYAVVYLSYIILFSMIIKGYLSRAKLISS